MLAEPEPQRDVPIPSPHPSTVLGSSLLDLTPEKPLPTTATRNSKRRSGNRIRPVILKQHDFQPPPLPPSRPSPSFQRDISPLTPIGAEGGSSELSVSALHSSGPLYLTLQEYHCNSRKTVIKRERRKEIGEGERVNHGLHDEMEDPLAPSLTPPRSSSPAVPELADHGIDFRNKKECRRRDEEDSADRTRSGMLEKKRYSDLVSVDVSDDSFQRLTTSSRVKTSHNGGGRHGTAISAAPAPNIMDFFSPSLEVEEMSIPPLSCLPPVQLATPTVDNALTLYHHFVT